MALFALVGIGTLIAFVTVRWTDSSARYVVALLIFTGIGFMGCAAAAMFAAARDTYAGAAETEESSDEAL